MNVLVEKNGPVTTIIINRPEVKNGVDGPTARELFAAFKDFEADPDASVAVLWGARGSFCAGADLKALSEPGLPRANPLEADMAAVGPMGPSRLELSKPVIAAISGYAVAGGMELAIWCDLRVMEEDAVMGIYCRRYGVPLIDGGTVRLARLIGLSRAMDLVLTGRGVNAEEALLMGLANRVVPTGKAREEAEALALKISGWPQTCMRNDRMAMLQGLSLPFDKAMKNEFMIGMDTIRSGETLDGAARYSSGKNRERP